MKAESAKQSAAGEKTVADTCPGLPLCNEAEDKAWNEALEKLRADWRGNKLSYSDYSARTESLEAARLVETVERARARADEYLDALLVIVGNHGNKALRFNEAFSLSKDPAFREEIAAVDSGENRATLIALLQTLSEIPREWSYLDLRRFLLGSGEQGKPKYKFTGRAMLKSHPDWSESEVTLVCEYLAGDESLYAAVLQAHQPTAAPDPSPEPPASGEDFEIVPAHCAPPREQSSRKPFDKEFIAALRERLSSRGSKP